MPETTPNLELRGLSRRELPHPFNSFTLSKLEKAGVPRLNTLEPQSSPPAFNAVLDAYYVQSGQEGTAWEGYEEVIASWTGGSWVKIPLRTGFFAWVLNEGLAKTYINAATGWVGFNEQIVITKQFNTIYGQGAGAQDYAASHLGPASSNSSSLKRLYWNTVFTPFGVQGGGSDTTPLYPLYRYTGTLNLGGSEGASMPAIVSGKVRIYASENEILNTTPIQIVNSPADLGTGQYASRLTSTTGVSSVNYKEDDLISPSEGDYTLLATLPAMNIQGGGTQALYEETINPFFTQLSPGYVSLRFERGAFTPGPGYAGSDERYSVLMEVELSISSNC